jgi:hypothetical protein
MTHGQNDYKIAAAIGHGGDIAGLHQCRREEEQVFR